MPGLVPAVVPYEGLADPGPVDHNRASSANDILAAATPLGCDAPPYRSKLRQTGPPQGQENDRVTSSPTPATEPPNAAARWRTRLRSVEAAAIAGVICAVAWSIGLKGLLAAPSVDASD